MSNVLGITSEVCTLFLYNWKTAALKMDFVFNHKPSIKKKKKLSKAYLKSRKKYLTTLQLP